MGDIYILIKGSVRPSRGESLSWNQESLGVDVRMQAWVLLRAGGGGLISGSNSRVAKTCQG